MEPLVSFNLWKWVEEHRQAFEPPVGNKVIWEDSQFTAMIIRGPNARRDFHVDPSDEIFYMLKGDMVLECIRDGRRREQVIREGELLLVPALIPHSPHRPPQKINVHGPDGPERPGYHGARRPTVGGADFCLEWEGAVQQVLDLLEDNGVAPEVGPATRMCARGPSTSVYFRDPDGNLVEFTVYDQRA